MDISHGKINPLTLRFHDRQLEREFFADYFAKVLRQVRISLLLAVFLYGIFGVLDALIILKNGYVARIMRYGVVVPFMMAAFPFSYSRNFSAFMQPTLFFIILLSGSSIIAMLLIAEPPGTYFYYAGLIIVIMYAYTLFRLRFLYAAIASWTLVLAYELSAVLIRPLPLSILTSNTFFLLSVNLIGTFAAYQLEYLTRRDFLQRKALREWEDQKRLREKEQILKDLHDGVGGMTTHIALLADTANRTRTPQGMQRALASIAELAEFSLVELRNFMRSLDRKDLTWEACAAEFRNIGGIMLEPHGILFVLRTVIEDNREQPDSVVYLHLFNIYREAVTNIVKHARATAVEALFVVGPDAVHLSIRDNGVGGTEAAAGGRGLRNMRMRAEEIGGTLTITVNAGTRVDLEIPLSGQSTAVERKLYDNHAPGHY